MIIRAESMSTLKLQTRYMAQLHNVSEKNYSPFSDELANNGLHIYTQLQLTLATNGK